MLYAVALFDAECSLTYLRDLYSPWELLPAVFYQRDRMLSKVRLGSPFSASLQPVQSAIAHPQSEVQQLYCNASLMQR